MAPKKKKPKWYSTAPEQDIKDAHFFTTKQMVDGVDHARSATLPEWMKEMCEWAQEVNEDMKFLLKSHGIESTPGDPPEPPW